MTKYGDDVPLKDWGSIEQIIGTSDGYITLSGTTEQYSSVVNMLTNGEESAHLVVEMDYDSTPTDEVHIKLYGSLDGTNFDDSPIWNALGNHDIDPEQLSFAIRDLAYWRIGVVQTGLSDSHNVRAYIRKQRR